MWYYKGMELVQFRRYFWDVDVSTLDPKRHSVYIIERLVEFGDEAAASWLFEHFLRQEILSVVDRSRRISPKSANYWRLILERAVEPV